MEFLVGSDPEVFLLNSSGEVVSAIGKIPGTKTSPKKLPKVGKGYAIQADNVLLEYNTPPANNCSQFRHSQLHIQNYLRDYLAGQNLTYRVSSSEIMPESELMHPRAHVFGCEPDFNAWTLEMNPPPETDDPRLRSAGGHVHIGIKLNKIQSIMLVRWLDVFVGVWSVIMDNDIRRRSLYGKAGAFRWKPYGIEYRSPSNFWIKSRELIDNMYYYIEGAVACVERGAELPEMIENCVEKTINNGDMNKALEIQTMCKGLYL